MTTKIALSRQRAIDRMKGLPPTLGQLSRETGTGPDVFSLRDDEGLIERMHGPGYVGSRLVRVKKTLLIVAPSTELRERLRDRIGDVHQSARLESKTKTPGLEYSWSKLTVESVDAIFDVIEDIAAESDEGASETEERIADEAEEAIRVSDDLTETEKQQLIKGRRGQGLFRRNVQQLEPACRVTGISDVRFLVASHIKPWGRCSNNTERLDGANGLLLTPNVDRLFDRGWITFDFDGSLRVADDADPDVLRALGVDSVSHQASKSFNERQRSYLEYHHHSVFRSSTGRSKGGE